MITPPDKVSFHNSHRRPVEFEQRTALRARIRATIKTTPTGAGVSESNVVMKYYSAHRCNLKQCYSIAQRAKRLPCQNTF
jgi:hypothetical protein